MNLVSKACYVLLCFVCLALMVWHAFEIYPENSSSLLRCSIQTSPLLLIISLSPEQGRSFDKFTTIIKLTVGSNTVLFFSLFSFLFFFFFPFYPLPSLTAAYIE